MTRLPVIQIALMACGLVALAERAPAGKVVVSNDDQTFSSLGFLNPNDAAQFAVNIAEFFTGGSPGNFLVYSDHPGLTNAQLEDAMTAAGHTWTVSTAGPFTLSALLAYDAVFVGGFNTDNNVLLNYVSSGGNVYLMAGSGPDGPFGDFSTEAASWNGFLQSQGLLLAEQDNLIAGSVPVSNGHPLMNGVDSLYQNNGQDILQLDPNSQAIQTQILVPNPSGPSTFGLYAVSVSPSHPPILNDECADAIDISPAREFSTVGATTNGPFEEFPCTAMGSDIWFRLAASCSGPVLADLCGSTFDTILAIYEGCPDDSGQYVACNDDRCGQASRTDWFAIGGRVYYIRIGGFEGTQGSGTLTITAEFSVVLGDVNRDGSVGLNDLTILLSHFGLSENAAFEDGNLDGDADVDLNDLTILLAHFGEACS